MGRGVAAMATTMWLRCGTLRCPLDFVDGLADSLEWFAKIQVAGQGLPRRLHLLAIVSRSGRHFSRIATQLKSELRLWMQSSDRLRRLGAHVCRKCRWILDAIGQADNGKLDQWSQ
jgi:hypothetical protein